MVLGGAKMDAIPTEPLTWMTFHRMRFHKGIDANECRFDGPLGATYTLLGPDSRLDENGMRTTVSDVWGGMAFYTDQRAAEAVIADPAALIPSLIEAVESWHALLCPISHRGHTTWFGRLENASRLVPAITDPGGPLAVMTSAGFNALPPDELRLDLPRRIDFNRNVDRVLAWYATLPDNIIRANFNLRYLGIDGLTFTLWPNEAAMTDAAYRAGIHRTQIDRYKNEQTADRSSFTRARLLRSVGTWDGDPLITSHVQIS
jgi:hypothetical protein